MKVNSLPLLLFPLVVTFVFALANGVQAQRGYVFTVNSVADSNDAAPGDTLCADTNGQCTLRAAIEESNATAATDAIIFNLPQPAVIDLTLGSLVITSSSEIVGPGARLLSIQRSTAPGTQSSRIFEVRSSQVRFNIRGVTIRNGNHGSGSGLLIESGANVSVTDSVISNNTAMSGAGIRVDQANLSLLRTLLHSNGSVDAGGAIYISGSTSNVTITCSTLTQNSASSGGAIYNEGNLLLINNTITDNLGPLGIGNINNFSGTVRVLNTIIGKNSAQAATSIKGAFVTLGNNIVSDSRDSSGFVNGVNNDQVSENNAIDPLLGQLENNGGQSDTMALLTGSPAFGNANTCIINGQCSQLPGVLIRASKDQRRNRRNDIFSATIDIGAYEQVSATIIGIATVGFFQQNAVGRHTNSLVILTNARTLERRITLVKLQGGFSFTQVRDTDDYVVEIKAKRSGMLTPRVIAFDGL